MGFSHSWIAVNGLEPAVALEALGMKSERQLDADEFPHRLGMGQLPGGWLLVLSSDFDDAFKRLAALASHGPAVACAVEEHVMCSEARGYADGAEVWRVVHDSTKGVYAIDVVGDPPGAFEGLHRDAAKEQDEAGGEDAGVDYLFDVPPLVAETVCGFRLDQPTPDGLRFAELRKAGGASATGDVKPGFLARLFGRR